MLPALHLKRPCQLLNFLSLKPKAALVMSAAGLAVSFMTVASAALASETVPNRLFDGQNVPDKVTKRIAQQMTYPAAPPPGKDNLVPPPAETQYFPIRSDGQPYMLMLDKTVNMTDALNRFYYDPKWRGELWVPQDPVTLDEKATRLMSTYQEYDQQVIYRVGNPIARWIERVSGYGP